MFNVSVDIKPKGDNKVCLTGSLLRMFIQVKPRPVCKLPADQELMYQVNTDQPVWAVHGKSTGKYQIRIDRPSTETNVQIFIWP